MNIPAIVTAAFFLKSIKVPLFVFGDAFSLAPARLQQTEFCGTVCLLLGVDHDRPVCGLGNYRTIFRSPFYRQAMQFSLQLTFSSSLCGLLIATVASYFPAPAGDFAPALLPS